MFPKSALRHPQRCASSSRHAVSAPRAVTASYATLRNLHKSTSEAEDIEPPNNDFILSILRANPSARDAKSYLASFGSPKPRPTPAASLVAKDDVPPPQITIAVDSLAATVPLPTPVVASILDPVHRRTALVKIGGPFTDRQLESIARGMVYLEKLGLLSIIVVESTDVPREAEGERAHVVEETMRVVAALERQGARARPFLGSVVRLGPKPGEAEDSSPEAELDYDVPEAHAQPSDLVSIRSAIRAGEVPVLAPLALDSFCRSTRVDANEVIGALARGMVEAATVDKESQALSKPNPDNIDLTPMRLMIISPEGGVPSYARSGLPHLLINTTSEYKYIRETFQRDWRVSHPDSISNLSLARTCLHYMPPTSSAIMVSHRSPSSLIANLITNKPAVSSSLPHALLQGTQSNKLTQHTPTLLRRGLPINVLRSASQIDKPKLKALLEQSFRRQLDEENFYARLEERLDFVIVAGDYAGAAIVTNESSAGAPIAYLDKFAVLPSHQGDGTVDFLWVALHDESYGLGLSYSANPNGGKGGQGEGRDLVWRSRADNPINRWYFERSTGYLRMGEKWVLFWCDAEMRLKVEEGRRANAGLRFVEEWEQGRLGVWADAVDKIPSAWK